MCAYCGEPKRGHLGGRVTGTDQLEVLVGFPLYCPRGWGLEAAIDLTSVPHAKEQNGPRVVIDIVNCPVVANPDAVGVCAAAQLLASSRSGIFSQDEQSVFYSLPGAALQTIKILSRTTRQKKPVHAHPVR